MDHIRLRDWCSTRRYNEDFVDEPDIEQCVIEKIIRNKFWDPLISSEEDEPVGVIDWNSIFKKKSAKERQFRIFVPGYRIPPQHPKRSALTQDEHRQCIKVLSANNKSILPNEFVGRPAKADLRVFEEKKQLYAAEQKEYLEWAKQLWVTTNCIRALRPKPMIEMVYEAEFKIKTHMMQCFPKTYKLAAQIPLKADNQSCEIIFPKKDLIEVDISKLPKVFYPNIYESQVSVLEACTVPEPCMQHPCKFKLPNETTVSLLPLTEVHKELAQFAIENGAEYITSEGAIKCMLEIDRSWTLPVSVCEVIAADGETSNVVVLGSEFPMKKDPAPVRSYRAFKHFLVKAFTSKFSRTRTMSDASDSSKGSTRNWNLRSRHNSKSIGAETRSRKNTSNSADKISTRRSRVSTDSHKAAVAYNANMRKIINQKEASDDSGEEDRLEIDLGDGNQNTEVFQFAAENQATKAQTNSTNEDRRSSLDHDTTQPRKILKARTRTSINKKDNHEDSHKDALESYQEDMNEDSQKNNHEDNHKDNHENNDMNNHENSNEENHENSVMEQIDIGRFNCVCKDSEYELPAPRSFKKWQIKNSTTKEQVNVIIHCSHKLRNDKSNEVIVEPIVEYQLDIGGTIQSPQKLLSLAFSLMLRKNADLVNVRVDGMGGEVVTVDTTTLKELSVEHGHTRHDVANTVCTALTQLAGLLPGDYLLRHEPAHGANAMLFARAGAGSSAGVGAVLSLASSEPLAAAEEARLVQTFPPLAPVLLPYHKYRRQLPLAFTYDQRQVVKETSKPVNKKKTPPAAIQWPKRCRGKNRRNKQQAMD